MVEVDFGLHELPHDGDVAAVGRWNQRRPTEAVRARQVGICTKDGPEDLYVAGLARREQRIGAHLVLDVDIGAGFDQRLDHLEIVGVDGRRDRGPSLRVYSSRRVRRGRATA